MKFLNHLLKKHWLLVLLVLLVLWLLPRLLDAYAYVFLRAGEFIEKVGAILKIPADTIAKGTAGIAAIAKAITDNALVNFVVPLILWRVAPIPAAILAAWGILDLLKPKETITITREYQPAPTVPAPVPTLAAPLVDFYSTQ